MFVDYFLTLLQISLCGKLWGKHFIISAWKLNQSHSDHNNNNINKNKSFD